GFPARGPRVPGPFSSSTKTCKEARKNENAKTTTGTKRQERRCGPFVCFLSRFRPRGSRLRDIPCESSDKRKDLPRMRSAIQAVGEAVALGACRSAALARRRGGARSGQRLRRRAWRSGKPS